MQKLPLYFDLREVVEGAGFIAALRMRGRVMGMTEFGSYWIYGVNPGGLAQNGDDPASARANFRRAVTEILFDFAEEASDFDRFREEVRSFLTETDDDSTEEWAEVRRQMRAGPVPEAGLRAETAELDILLEIRNLLDPASGPEPRINVLPVAEDFLAA